MSDQTIYKWRRQDRIDRGELAGLTTVEKKVELAAANKKISELETELATARKALELLGPVVPAIGRYAAIKTMAADGHPGQVTCRLLGVAESGHYEWGSRKPSPRAVQPGDTVTETVSELVARRKQGTEDTARNSCKTT